MDSVGFENQMQDADTVEDRLILARLLLQPVIKRDAAWPALAATAFFAVCAMTFAVTAIMTPAQDYAPVPDKHGTQSQ